MSPTMRANILQEIVIDGQSAGPGNPSIDITDAHGKSPPPLYSLSFPISLDKRRTILYLVH